MTMTILQAFNNANAAEDIDAIDALLCLDPDCGGDVAYRFTLDRDSRMAIDMTTWSTLKDMIERHVAGDANVTWKDHVIRAVRDLHAMLYVDTLYAGMSADDYDTKIFH